VEVVVPDGGPVSAVGGGPVQLSQDALSNLSVPERGGRRVTAPAGLDLSVVESINPFALATVVAKCPDRGVISSTPPHQDRHGRGVLPLAVHNHWCAMRSEQQDVLTVVFLVAGVATTEMHDQLVADVFQRLPQLAKHLPSRTRRQLAGTSVGSSTWDAGPTRAAGVSAEQSRAMTDDW
jgi:hypothetical protein